MNTAPPAIRDYARRLIAIEAARIEPPVTGSVASRVCEKLRVPLVKLAGIAGFRSLLSRAVAMAKAEVPSLSTVNVQTNGAIEGLDQVEQAQPTGSNDQAGYVIVAELLGLLVTFIGEPLTLGLVRGAWPNESLPDLDSECGSGS